MMKELKGVGHKIVVYTAVADEENIRRLSFVDEVVGGRPKADVFVGYSRDDDIEMRVGWKLRNVDEVVGLGWERGSSRVKVPEDLKLPRSFHIPRSFNELNLAKFGEEEVVVKKGPAEIMGGER